MTDWTERLLLDALWARLTAAANGFTPRYAMAEHVRHDPMYGNHIADAIAIDSWGSGSWSLEGYEVKITRSDWRRELPAGRWIDRDHPDRPVLDVPYVKSYPWRRHCARWYVLAPAGVVPLDDLPPGWGLVEASTDRSDRPTLRARRKAHNDPGAALPLHPRQVAGLMRATQATAIAHTRRSLCVSPS